MQESSDSNTASEETEKTATDENGSSEDDEELSQKKEKAKTEETTDDSLELTEGKLESELALKTTEEEPKIKETPETTEITEITEELNELGEPEEPEEPEEPSKEADNRVESEDSEFFRLDTDDSDSYDDISTIRADVTEKKSEAQDIEAAEEIEEMESKAEKGSFLELDSETRERMKIIEEEEQRAAEQQRLEEEEAEFMETGIFAIKTSIGHEKMVANWIALRARKRKLSVFAILSPPKLRGYLLLEGVKNKEALQDLIKGVQHARSVVDGMSSLEEIEHFLTPKPLVSGIEEGDVVEIIAGPFKGEKAKVTQIDESKEEITVELFEAMVSIPVTIRGDHVRILEKESK